MKRIAAVTSTRADYGLLYWVLKAIDDDPEMELTLIATGSHLSEAHGMTVNEIERDGFRVAHRVQIEPGDSRLDTAKSLSRAVWGIAEVLDAVKPEAVLLLGDRFEILGAAAAAMLLGLPIAHLFGGDVTEGAFDDAIRHSITKMSHLHFVSNEESARRVRQLGEDPARVFVTGSTGLDTIRRAKVLSREELGKSIGFDFRDKNLLVTFHPSTLANERVEELLAALDELPELGILFTKGNIDPGSLAIGEAIDAFVASHPNAKAYVSLGHERYVSAMANVDAVVGNSSSGLYEAPSFRKPTVDIGDRQKGRLRASSVIHVPAERKAIADAIRKALTLDCSDAVNPYGDGHAAERVHRVLRETGAEGLLEKRFVDLQ